MPEIWTLEVYRHFSPETLECDSLEEALSLAIHSIEYNEAYPKRLLSPDGSVYAEAEETEHPWYELYKSLTGHEHESLTHMPNHL